jgi:hypothetical protein
LGERVHGGGEIGMIDLEMPKRAGVETGIEDGLDSIRLGDLGDGGLVVEAQIEVVDRAV